MRWLVLVAMSGCTLVPVGVPTTDPPIPTPELSNDYHPTAYNLVWHDEFNGTQLDRTNNWCTRFSWGGGIDPVTDPDDYCQPPSHPGDGTLQRVNNEQHMFVEVNPLNEPMHAVDNKGVLALRATKTRPDPGWNWALAHSAMIRSKKTFKPTATTSYYITGKFLMPNFLGAFPAFWLASHYNSVDKLVWPPEIDMFEHPINNDGDDDKTLHQAAIPVPGSSKQRTYADGNFDTQWNNYRRPDGKGFSEQWVEVGVDWRDSSYCTFVDGVKTFCETYSWVGPNGAESGPANILINLSIGGPWAGRKGVDWSALPTALYVDYVRVYVKTENR